MSARRRAWLNAATAALIVVAVLVGWGSYSFARTVPHRAQTAPGGSATFGKLPVRLLSLVVTPGLVTGREVNHASAGALWVIAQIEYVPGEDTYCDLHLLAVDGRTWRTASSLDWNGSRTMSGFCDSDQAGVPARAELIYLIPASAADALAGLSSRPERGTEPIGVLTPPS